MRKKSEAKIFLEQVERSEITIRNKLIERQQWKDLALNITANMDGERVQSSGSKDKMASAVNRCLDAAGEIDGEVEKLVGVKKAVTQTIEKLYSPTEYDVLHKRYIQYLSLQEVADAYGKDYDWAKVNCQRGTNHVQAILNKNK